LVSKYGGGLILSGVSSDKESATAAMSGISALYKSINFFPTMKSSKDIELQNAFAGKRLSYMQTLNGYSETRIIWLCKSGDYTSQTGSNSSSAVSIGTIQGKNYGTWEVKYVGELIYLILRSQTGELYQYTVTGQSSNAVGLNGVRYFVANSDECN
jgi:hypothetical protein